MAAKLECTIAHTKLSYPVGIGHDESENMCGLARYNIDAIAVHIATDLVNRKKLSCCPFCQREIKWIRLDIKQVSHGEEEYYQKKGNPKVLALAIEIAKQFRESSLVQGQPCVQELTLQQMIAIHDRLISPNVSVTQKEKQYNWNDCLKNANPIALVVAVFFALYSVVRFIFTPNTGVSNEPKKNSSRSSGTFINRDNFV